jgi:hypothetical protein
MKVADGTKHASVWPMGVCVCVRGGGGVGGGTIDRMQFCQNRPRLQHTAHDHSPKCPNFIGKRRSNAVDNCINGGLCDSCLQQSLLHSEKRLHIFRVLVAGEVHFDVGLFCRHFHTASFAEQLSRFSNTNNQVAIWMFLDSLLGSDPTHRSLGCTLLSLADVLPDFALASTFMRGRYFRVVVLVQRQEKFLGLRVGNAIKAVCNGCCHVIGRDVPASIKSCVIDPTRCLCFSASLQLSPTQVVAIIGHKT